MQSNTGPQMSPRTTAWVAVSTDTVSSRLNAPNRPRYASSNVR